MNKIAILITCYNRKDKTLKCLECLYKQNCSFDVYLVNDGCTDGTPDAVKRKYPEVNIIDGDGSLFWNKGMRLAWQVAQKKDYDFYVWLNDDTFIFNDALDTLLSCSQKYENHAIIVGACCDPLDSTKTTFGGEMNGCVLILNNEVEQECDSFGGNFVLIPKYVYQLCGMLDSYYMHSFGDTDYATMAKKNGIKMYLSATHIGTCIKDAGSVYIPWLDMSKTFKKRWKDLHSPLGYSIPKEVFYFYKKKDNIIIALLHCISVYYRFFIKRKWDK